MKSTSAQEDNRQRNNTVRHCNGSNETSRQNRLTESESGAFQNLHDGLEVRRGNLACGDWHRRCNEQARRNPRSPKEMNPWRRRGGWTSPSTVRQRLNLRGLTRLQVVIGRQVHESRAEYHHQQQREEPE